MENPTGSCRLCLVEIEGELKPRTSCLVKGWDGMVVKTDTPTVRQLQRIDFQLIMTAHHMDCKNCLSKRHCELQKIAKLLGVRLKVTEYEKLERLNLAVIKHPCFDPVPAHCILCRKCLFVCGRKNPEPILKLARRGFEHVIEVACDDYPEKLPCKDSHACVKVCPVSAIVSISTDQEQKSA